MKSLKINALSNVMIKILNIVFPLITGPYIARVLDKTDYGNFNIANTLINLFIPIATLGVYNYGIREVSRVIGDRNKINHTFSKLFYVSTFGTIVTTIVYYIYIFSIYSNISIKPLCYILGAQIFAQMFYIEWMNEAFENYTFILYKTLFIRILLFIGLFVFVKKESDVIPYAIIMTVLNSANFIISFIWIKKNVRLVKVSFEEIKKLIGPLISVLLLTNANMMFTILDRAFLSYISTPEYVTFYTIAQNIITIISGVILGAITVNVPRMNYYLGNGDEKSYVDLVNITSRIYAFLIIPLSIGLIMLSSYAMLLYGGSKYIGAGLITGIFSFRIITLSIDVILGNLIIFARGYEKALTINYFIGGFINLIFNFILAYNNIIKPELYIITTIFSEYIVWILHVILIKRKGLFNLKQIFINIARYIIISLGFVPIYIIYTYFYPIELIIDISNILHVFIYIFICMLYYAVINICLKDKIIIYCINLIKNLKNKFIINRK